MIDEKELERVCRLAGLEKITTAKIPTYRTKEGTAAIELTKDGLKGFWFIKGERDYDNVMDDLKICSVLQAFEAESSKYEPILDPKTQKKVGERLKVANVGIVEDQATIPAAAGAALKKTCACGKTIEDKFDMCFECHKKTAVSGAKGNDKFLFVLTHIEWDLARISKSLELLLERGKV